MKLSRQIQLERGPDPQVMTFEEMIQGWHWCIEFDFMVTDGERKDEDGRCLCGIRGADLLIARGCLDSDIKIRENLERDT